MKVIINKVTYDLDTLNEEQKKQFSAEIEKAKSKLKHNEQDVKKSPKQYIKGDE